MEMVDNMMAVSKYPKYKNSGVKWLTQVPSEWGLKKMKFLFKDVSVKNKPEEELLSVTQNQGVVPRSWVENRMVMPTGNLESFKFIRKGNFAISLRSFEGGLEFCYHDGIISPAYTVLKMNESLYPGYYRYLFKSFSFISEIQTSVVGIREGKNISYPELSQSLIPIPNIAEQRSIAEFLDDKTSKIDRAIAQKERMIELLKERKQIIIQNAVTKGLDPNVKMKDSGVDWIGEIPEHWEVKRLKFLLSEFNVRSTSGKEELLSLSKYKGVIPKSSLEERAGGAESLIGYKIVNPRQLVINKMQAVNGLLAVSKIHGITSPDYSIYYSKNEFVLDINYLEYLLLQVNYLAEFKRRVTGVMEGFIRLYTDDLFGISINLPPLDEQKSIINHIVAMSTKIENTVVLEQSQIEKLKEYKATLIDSAVTGKIKVC